MVNTGEAFKRMRLLTTRSPVRAETYIISVARITYTAISNWFPTCVKRQLPSGIASLRGIRANVVLSGGHVSNPLYCVGAVVRAVNGAIQYDMRYCTSRDLLAYHVTSSCFACGAHKATCLMRW